jgi:hypothetical protein
MNFLELPDGVMTHLVLSWLPLADIGRLDSAVCNHKQRGNFLRFAFAYGTLDIREFVESNPAELIKFNRWIFLRNASVSAIEINSMLVNDTPALMNFLATKGTHIQSIFSLNDLRVGYHIPTETIIQHCPNLTSLDASCLTSGELLSVLPNFPRLQRIIVGSHVQPKEIDAIGMYCSDLRRFEYRKEYSLQARLYNQSYLAFARYDSRRVPDQLVLTLSTNCHNLTVLSVSAKSFTDDTIGALAENCPHLRELYLDFDERTVIIGTQTMDLLLSACPLTHLALTHWRGNSDTVLESISVLCTQLQYVSVQSCRQVSDSGVHHLAQRLPHLCSATVADCPLITDSGLLGMADGCPNLEDLIVSESRNVSIVGIKSVFQRCRQLKQLHCYCCAKMIDVELFSHLTLASEALCKVVLPTGAECKRRPGGKIVVVPRRR